MVWIRTLTGLRRSTRSLRAGEFRRLDSERLLAFTRFTETVDDFVTVLANPSDEPVREFTILRDSKIANAEPMRCALTGIEGRTRAGGLMVEVPPRTALVMRPVHAPPERGFDPYKRVL